MGGGKTLEGMGLFVDADMHRLRWGRVLALVSGLAVVTAVVVLYCRDEPPPDDADMQIHSPPVADEENGMVQLGKLDWKTLDFYAYAEAHGVDDMEIGNISDGLTRNDTVVDAFLNSVAPEMEQLDAILALPHFEIGGKGPFKPQAFVARFPEIGSLLNAGKVLRLRAMRRAQAGNYIGATDDVLRLRHLVQRVTEGYLTQVHLLTVFAVDGIANWECSELLNDRRMPESEIARLVQAWNTETPWPEIYHRSVMQEYHYISDILMTAKEEDYERSQAAVDLQLSRISSSIGGSPIKVETWEELLWKWQYSTLQPNTTRRLILEVARPGRHLLDGTYAAQTRPTVQRPSTDWEAIFWALMPNVMGRELARSWPWNLDASAKEGFVMEAQDRLAQAGLALRRYYNEHGTLPANLGSLVPKYLAAVPLDPYDGKPLRYDAARRLVYAVGTSLTDNDGSKFVGKPTSAYDYENPFGDREQPTLELKFAQKAGP